MSSRISTNQNNLETFNDVRSGLQHRPGYAANQKELSVYGQYSSPDYAGEQVESGVCNFLPEHWRRALLWIVRSWLFSWKDIVSYVQD